METKEIQQINTTSKKKYSFGLTSFTWHEMPITKLDLDGLENLLEEKMHLSNYGQGLKQIMVSFVVYPDSMPWQKKDKEERIFSLRKKMASLSVELDYEKLLFANSEEAFEMMKIAYYSILEEVLPTFEINFFDFKAFLKDLKEILQIENIKI